MKHAVVVKFDNLDEAIGFALATSASMPLDSARRVEVIECEPAEKPTGKETDYDH